MCQDGNSFVRSQEEVDDPVKTVHSNIEGTIDDTGYSDSSTSREEVVIDYVNIVKTRDVDILKSVI